MRVSAFQVSHWNENSGMKTVERVYDRDEGDERLRNRATVSIELDNSEKSIERVSSE